MHNPTLDLFGRLSKGCTSQAWAVEACGKLSEGEVRSPTSRKRTREMEAPPQSEKNTCSPPMTEAAKRRKNAAHSLP